MANKAIKASMAAILNYTGKKPRKRAIRGKYEASNETSYHCTVKQWEVTPIGKRALPLRPY